MTVFLADRPVAATARGAVAVLGNLDGVHLGHQALMEAAAGAAREQGAKLAAVTFDPHPRRLFQPEAEPFLITTLDRRAELLRAAGAAHVFAIPFTRDTAAMSPEEFVDEMLIERLGLAGVVVGAEFEFG
ncbi:MAG: bifunctional riboflavin kinase/FMN adenylyltransferase, partial [Pseudomonadota bacterium]